MKKVILSGIIACLLAPIFALSWNGVIDNTSKLSSNDDFSALTLDQSNGIHLSVNAPFNTSGTMKFVAEGSFKYDLISNFEAKTSDLKILICLSFLENGMLEKELLPLI